MNGVAFVPTSHSLSLLSNDLLCIPDNLTYFFHVDTRGGRGLIFT